MTGAAQMLTVRVPLAVRKQRGGRKLVVTPASSTNRGPSAADTTLVKALARAFRWRRMMETGRFATFGDLAVAEKINKTYLCRMMKLTLLSPEIISEILAGEQSQYINLKSLLDNVPPDWSTQKNELKD